MASYCCVCKKKIGLFDSTNQIVLTIPEYQLCEKCFIKHNELSNSSAEMLEENLLYFQELLAAPDTPVEIQDHFLELAGKKTHREILQEKIEAEQKEFNNRLSNMLLTTGSSFDGYAVAKYIDVICEEVIFKNSFMNWLSAGFEDLGNVLTFKEAEMSGCGELISRARAHVKEKFRKKAAQLGANAVLGVEFESSIGAEVVRVAIFGTAVIIVPIES